MTHHPILDSAHAPPADLNGEQRVVDLDTADRPADLAAAERAAAEFLAALGRERPPSFASKRPVHDVEANEPVCWVIERLRHRGKDPKAEGAPQPDRRCVGFDDRIELHRPVAVGACLFEDVAAQSPADPLAAPRRVHDKAGIGDVRPRAGMYGLSVRAADDTSLVIHGDDRAAR
jgi:hypothetical protein